MLFFILRFFNRSLRSEVKWDAALLMLKVDLHVLTAIKHGSKSQSFGRGCVGHIRALCGQPCRGSLMSAGWADKQKDRRTAEEVHTVWKRKVPIKSLPSSGLVSFCSFGGNVRLPLITPALSIVNRSSFLPAWSWQPAAIDWVDLPRPCACRHSLPNAHLDTGSEKCCFKSQTVWSYCNKEHCNPIMKLAVTAQPFQLSC